MQGRKKSVRRVFVILRDRKTLDNRFSSGCKTENSMITFFVLDPPGWKNHIGAYYYQMNWALVVKLLQVVPRQTRKFGRTLTNLENECTSFIGEITVFHRL